MQRLARSWTRDARHRAALAVDKPFRRYGPMGSQEVRQADVQGTDLERLRQRLKMLREMTPEQALAAIDFREKMNFFQAIALAKQEGKLIVPNIVHDRILTETKDEKYLRQNYPVWTGTLIIYEKPDKKFGKKVVFRWKDDIKYSITFSVPEQFRGKANCALAVDYPDFEVLELGNNKYELKLVEGANIHLIENFPAKNGWHNLHPETKIPQGEPVRESQEARYLWRSKDSSYVGLLVRSSVYGGQVVYAGFRASDRLGVALF